MRFWLLRSFCESSGHENIIAIIGSGRLSSSKWFYIDMELCDLDLNAYIWEKSSRGLIVDGAAEDCGTNDVFVPYDCSFPLNMRNTYKIMSHIAHGLAFIHMQGLAHRDLKPRNGTSIPTKADSKSYIHGLAMSGSLQILDLCPKQRPTRLLSRMAAEEPLPIVPLN